MKYICIKSLLVSDVNDEDEWVIEIGSEWCCDSLNESIRLENHSDDSWIEINKELLTEHFEVIQEEQQIKEGDKLVNTSTMEVCTFIKRQGDYFKITNSEGKERDVGIRYFERYYVSFCEKLLDDLKSKKTRIEEES